MYCQNCGAELTDNAKYCSECGAKVDVAAMTFCRECGASLPVGASKCEYCGADVIPSDSFLWAEEDQAYGRWEQNSSSNKSPRSKSKHTKRSRNTAAFRVAIIALAFFAALVIGGTSFIKAQQKAREEAAPAIPESAPTIPVTIVSTEGDAIESTPIQEKGMQYAFMSDQWNVYIATVVSDSVIKIEHWSRTKTSDREMSYRSDVGVYKTDDSETGFYWVDEEHTAFVISFCDEHNSRVGSPQPHVFTINISDNNRCKGSDYDESIACYSYTFDRWHEYRAIPLTDRLIKIECWYRTSADDELSFGWDWCVIDTEATNTGFEWTDEDRSSFTMTTIDLENGNWESPSFVLFELENPNRKYPDVISYLSEGNANWWDWLFNSES